MTPRLAAGNSREASQRQTDSLSGWLALLCSLLFALYTFPALACSCLYAFVLPVDQFLVTCLGMHVVVLYLCNRTRTRTLRQSYRLEQSYLVQYKPT